MLLIFLFYILPIIIGYVLDYLWGDPEWFPHPVIFIGKFISFLEKQIRKRIDDEEDNYFYAGIVLCAAVVLLTGIITWIITKLASDYSLYLYIVISSLIFWMCFSNRCLSKEGMRIYSSLEAGDIELSRKNLGRIVGRETSELSEDEIVRATVETMSENLVDGFVSPLFWGIIGGPVFAMMFKAVNTLDSMVGYKNEKYILLGRASAILDDALNYIPARIGGVIIVLTGIIFDKEKRMETGMEFTKKSRIGVFVEDRKNHTSPNCAYPEAAFSGILGIRLGGTHTYFGKEVFKPDIGFDVEFIDYTYIKKANILMHKSAFATILIMLAAGFLIRII